MEVLTKSELLLYIGIIAMAAACLFGVLCTILFLAGWKRLKRKLEQEYGKSMP